MTPSELEQFLKAQANMSARIAELGRDHLRVHKHEYSVAIAMGRTMRAEQAANAFVLAKIQSKILPPLQAKDEDALEAQDFLRLFRLDIVRLSAPRQRPPEPRAPLERRPRLLPSGLPPRNPQIVRSNPFHPLAHNRPRHDVIPRRTLRHARRLQPSHLPSRPTTKPRPRRRRAPSQRSPRLDPKHQQHPPIRKKPRQ